MYVKRTNVIRVCLFSYMYTDMRVKRQFFYFLAESLRSERRGSTLASKGPPKAGGCPRGTRWLPQELALSAPPIGSNFALNNA